MNKHKLTILGILLISTLWAQMPGAIGPHPQEPDRPDRMGMMAMWRLTEELKLTEDQGARFFPDFREYREKQMALEKERRTLAEDLRTQIRDKDELSDQDLQSALDQWFGLETRRMTIEKEFLTKTGSYLDNVQQLKLAMARERFKNELRSQMKNRDRGRYERWDRPRQPRNRAF
ncbi:MAG: hypothetical protein GXO90_01690 [FCB group bacterium]|nr:hypothetical protein [FCB group bacterium]